MFVVSFSSLSLSPHTFICFLFEKRKKKPKKENKANTWERRKGRHATRPTSAVFFCFCSRPKTADDTEKKNNNLRFASSLTQRRVLLATSRARVAAHGLRRRWRPLDPPTFSLLLLVLLLLLLLLLLLFRWFFAFSPASDGPRPAAVPVPLRCLNLAICADETIKNGRWPRRTQRPLAFSVARGDARHRVLRSRRVLSLPICNYEDPFRLVCVIRLGISSKLVYFFVER